MNVRNQTRLQRYLTKNARTMPISVACINFMHDENVAFVIRAAACFGAESVHVVGALPKADILKAKSGTTSNLMKVHQHSNPIEFLKQSRKIGAELVSFELSENSTPIELWTPAIDRKTILVVGHEEVGVPVEIMNASKKVFIPMFGFGACLNTSQAANIALFHASQKVFQ